LQIRRCIGDPRPALDAGNFEAALDHLDRAFKFTDQSTKKAVAKDLVDTVSSKNENRAWFNHSYLGFDPIGSGAAFLEKVMPLVRKKFGGSDVVPGAVAGATVGGGLGFAAGGPPGAIAGGAVGGAIGAGLMSKSMKRLGAPELLEERATAGAAATEATTRAARRLKLGLPELGRRFDQSDQWWHGNYGIRQRRFWKQFSDDQLLGMMSDFEHGKKTGNAQVDHLFETYHKIQDYIYNWDQEAGIKYRKREHYLYHAFKNSEQAEAFYSKLKGLYGGKSGFTKPKYFDDVVQARASGFQLKTNNPFDLLSLRWFGSVQDHFMLETVQKLEQWGEAFSGDKATKEIQDNPSYQMFPDSPDGRAYWIRGDKVVTLRNAFDNRPLELLGPVTKFFRNLKGYSLGLKLLGAFHGLHIGGGLVHAERLTTMIDKIRSGNFRAKDMKEVASFMGGKGTSNIMRYFRNEIPAGELTGPELELVRYLDRTGIDPTKNEDRELEFVAKLPLPKGVGGKIDHAAQLGYNFTRWLALQPFFFENMIPRMKIESVRQRVEALRQSNPELFAPSGDKWLSIELRKIGLDVDRRFGERNYRTFFTPNWMKQIGISGLLSPSWDMSFITAGGIGAIYDLAHNVYHFDEIMKADRAGDTLNGRFLTNRVIFSAWLSMLTAAANGIMTGLFTGQTPTGQDFFWPRIGENPDGSDKRLNTFFWITEWARLANYIYQDGPLAGPWRFARNKLQPVASTFMELIQNRDYYGRKIHDDNPQVMDGKLESWGQFAVRTFEEMGKYAAENMLEPIFVESTMTHPPAGMTWGEVFGLPWALARAHLCEFRPGW
jgi:hypothetical protein